MYLIFWITVIYTFELCRSCMLVENLVVPTVGTLFQEVCTVLVCLLLMLCLRCVFIIFVFLLFS